MQDLPTLAPIGVTYRRLRRLDASILEGEEHFLVVGRSTQGRRLSEGPPSRREHDLNRGARDDRLALPPLETLPHGQHKRRTSSPCSQPSGVQIIDRLVLEP